MAAVLGLVSALAIQGASASFFSLPTTFPNISACASEPSIYSCENTTVIQNTCCSPTPGGLVLQTQFWDTNPSTGPSNSWTIHGTSRLRCALITPHSPI